MAKINADDLREAWLNPPDDVYEITGSFFDDDERLPPRIGETKAQIMIWWSMCWDATKIIKEMTDCHDWFYMMTPSTVERWKRLILAHDRRLTGGKVLSELGELL